MGTSRRRTARLVIDGYKCLNCGEQASQVHHIVPEAVGGLDILSNLASLCDECHSKVHGTKAVNHSELTKAGLQKARARGVRLGGTGGSHASLAGMNAARKRKAEEHRATVRPLATHLRQQGMTLQAIADTLNATGSKTPAGCEWRPVQVKRVLEEPALTV